MSERDYLQRFLFEHHAVRGEFIFLHDTFQTVVAQRNYPNEVGQLLGEAMAATALLSATIKYKGSLTLQAQTAGPVHLLVVQSDQDLNMRALAKWQDDAYFSERLLGEGHLVITLLPDAATEPHQGVVPLTASQLNKNIEAYFEQSEQLPTQLWLAADSKRAVGFLIQKMPNPNSGEQASGEEWNYWEHISTLAATITREELLALDTTTILHRLFHEEDIRLYETQPIHFHCRCNKEKMIQALKTMSEEEVRSILSMNNFVEVTCDFCNTSYAFNQQEVDVIYS